MLQNILPFQIEVDTVFIAGTSLWALALYLGLASVRDWVETQLFRWFSFAERFMYFSEQEYEETRTVREHQNELSAAILGIVPFLLLGLGCHWGMTVGLGSSWAISFGLMACVGCGVYELGRRSGSQEY